MRDGEREPLIQKLASPIYDNMSGVKEQIGWLLNGQGGPCGIAGHGGRNAERPVPRAPGDGGRL